MSLPHGVEQSARNVYSKDGLIPWVAKPLGRSQLEVLLHSAERTGHAVNGEASETPPLEAGAFSRTANPVAYQGLCPGLAEDGKTDFGKMQSGSRKFRALCTLDGRCFR